MPTKARYALSYFEGFELHLIQIDDLATLAETALHQHSRQGFLRVVRGREVDVPKIRTGIENCDGVDEATRFAVNLGDDAGAGRFRLIAFQFPVKYQFLARKELVLQANDAAVAADHQRLRGLPVLGPVIVHRPRRIDLHLQGNPVALADPVAWHA